MWKQVQWSNKLAYVVGLITTDGSLSKDGRHIDITSKDKNLLEDVKESLGLKIQIGQKYSGQGNISWRLQIGSKQLYKFLRDIGLTPAKTKTVGELLIPKRYFCHFLRGHFDGDGSFYCYQDIRWKSSFMFYLSFVSASKIHIEWLQKMIYKTIGVKGHITTKKEKDMFQLKFGKNETKILVPKMYVGKSLVCLERKRKKIFTVLKREKLAC